MKDAEPSRSADDRRAPRTPHRHWYISICTVGRFLVPDSPHRLESHSSRLARSSSLVIVVIVTAIPSGVRSFSEDCLFSLSFPPPFPLPRCRTYRCGWRFFAFYFPGRLRASLLEPRNDLCDQLDSSFSLAPRHNSYPNCRLSSFPPAARSPGSSSIRSAGSLSPPDVASSLMVVVLFVVFPLPSPQPPSRRCGHPLCELTLPRPDFVGDFGVPSTISSFNANEL